MVAAYVLRDSADWSDVTVPAQDDYPKEKEMDKSGQARLPVGPLSGWKLRRAVGTFKPLGIAFRELQHQYERGNPDAFRTRETLLLAQLITSDRAQLRDFTGHLISYLSGARSSHGLESLILTSTHMAWLARDVRMYRAALNLWKGGRPDRGEMGELVSVTFFDRQHNLATAVTSKMFDRIKQDLLNGVLGGRDIGSTLRGFGPGIASDGVNDYVQCVSGYVEMFGIIGAGVGTVLGAPGGVAGIGTGAAIVGTIGGLFGLGMGITACIPIEDTPPPPEEQPGQSEPVSSNETPEDTEGESGEMAGGTDEGGGSDGSDEPDDEEVVQDDGSADTALVYPVPDDLRGFAARNIELMSTPTADGDIQDPGGPHVGPGPNPASHTTLVSTPTEDGEIEDRGGPQIGPGPNPALRGSATFALHGLNALIGGSRLERLPATLRRTR